MLDTFEAAVAQARNPRLPAEAMPMVVVECKTQKEQEGHKEK